MLSPDARLPREHRGGPASTAVRRAPPTRAPLAAQVRRPLGTRVPLRRMRASRRATTRARAPKTRVSDAPRCGRPAGPCGGRARDSRLRRGALASPQWRRTNRTGWAVNAPRSPKLAPENTGRSGCDGVTYDNECMAHSSGVSVDHMGDVKPAAASRTGECAKSSARPRPTHAAERRPGRHL